MKKLKKYIIIPLCACIFLSAGCDGEEEPDPASTAITDEDGAPVTDANGNMIPTFTDADGNIFAALTDENGAVVTDEDGNMLPAPEEEKKVYKAGFIYNTSVEYGSTSKIFENARKQIEKDLEIETCFIDGVLVSEIPLAVNALLEEGCNIIVSCCPRFNNSIAKEAKSASETYFINFGGTSSAHNISGLGGELYQTANVCGMAGAYNTDTNILGIIADQSAYNSYGVIDAFVLGAKEIMLQTDVRMDWIWSKDKDKIEEAVDDLVSQGCDVIMCYTENDYAPIYAASRGVKVIANSCDLPELIPDNYLTGFYFNFSTFLVDTVRAISADCFVSSVNEGGIASGKARLLDFSENCKEGTEDICTKLYDYIKNGQAHVFTGEIKSRTGTVMIEKGQKMSFSGIRKIDWLIQGITYVGNYTTVTYDLTPSELIIKQ